jgi:hypothetical protein
MVAAGGQGVGVPGGARGPAPAGRWQQRGVLVAGPGPYLPPGPVGQMTAGNQGAVMPTAQQLCPFLHYCPGELASSRIPA